MFSLCFSIYSQSSFEIICKTIIKENPDIKNAENELSAAKTQKYAPLALLLPAISFQGSLYYNYDTFQKEYPNEGEITANISQYFLGGSTLTISGTFDYYNTEANTCSYEPAANSSLYLTQSLCPWWLSIKGKNPDFYIPKLNYINVQTSVSLTEFRTLKDFLLLFLDYKTLIQKIDISEKAKNYYKEYYEANLELFKKGNTSFINLFDINEKYVEACDNYDSLLNEKNTYINQFCQLTGNVYDKNSMENLLSSSIKETWDEVFRALFPHWNYDNYMLLSEKLNDTSLKYEKSNYLSKRQQLAPKLIAGVTCDYDIETKHNFSVSIGMDLSTLFSPQTLCLKKNYEMEKKKLELQKRNSSALNQNIKEEYEENLMLLKQQCSNLEMEFKALEKIYVDYQHFYKNGNCSKLDFLNIELMYYQIKNSLTVCKDKLSYYFLILNIEILK